MGELHPALAVKQMERNVSITNHVEEFAHHESLLSHVKASRICYFHPINRQIPLVWREARSTQARRI